MAGETQITVVGNLTGDPELRYTPSGSAVANFTIAVNAKRFDKQRNEWVDQETTFWRAAIWRDYAEHVAASLNKGMQVIAQGVVKSRSYTTKEGENRTVLELELSDIGPTLRFAEAKVTSAAQSSTSQPSGGGFGSSNATTSTSGDWGQPAQSAGGWGASPASADPPF